MNSTDKIVGDIIKQKRRILRITQEQLGRRVGVAASTITCYESGIRGMSLEMFFKLCNVLLLEPNDVKNEMEQRMEWLEGNDGATVTDFERFNAFLGNKIRSTREENGFSLEDMAAMISNKLQNSSVEDISAQTYAYYESGERSMPVDVFACVCEILSLDKGAVFNEAYEYLLN